MIGQFIKYCLVGALNTGVGLAIIFMAMATFHLSPVIANAVGFGAGFLVSYALNRKWTFQSNRSVQWSFPLFALICAIGYALNLAALIIALNILEIAPYLAQLIGVGAYAIFVFLGSRFVAFRR